MATTVLERPMAGKRNDVSVKMDASVVDDAKIVASYKKLSLAQYLSETLRPIVAQQLEEEHSKRSKGQGKAPKH